MPLTEAINQDKLSLTQQDEVFLLLSIHTGTTVIDDCLLNWRVSLARFSPSITGGK